MPEVVEVEEEQIPGTAVFTITVVADGVVGQAPAPITPEDDTQGDPR